MKQLCRDTAARGGSPADTASVPVLRSLHPTSDGRVHLASASL